MGGLFATSCEESTTSCALVFRPDLRPILSRTKKLTQAAKTRSTTTLEENRAIYKTPDSERPILSEESGAFISRLREVIGEESVSSFSRRCGIKEAVIRSYINDGRAPPIFNVVAMADAGGVTVDWLATGREPKTRAGLKAAQQAARKPSEVDERCVLAETLPRRDTYLDCTGRLREFELTQNVRWPGAHVRANEITADQPGYRFEAWAATPAEAIAKLNQKIKDGLARRYLAEHPDRGLEMLSDRLAGTIELGGLSVDGRLVDWDWIETQMQTHEGGWVEIRFKDPAE